MNIFILEDETDIRELLEFQLFKQGFKVTTAGDVKTFHALFPKQKIDLFLIDRMLPDGNGTEVCQEIRNHPEYKKTPIIFVTALTQPENIVEGLEAGADDYITKPFDNTVLIARVKNQLKRVAQSVNSTKLNFKLISIDVDKCEVFVQNQKISLTATEFKILSFLATNSGIVHTRDKLIRQVIGDDIHVTSRTIDTHMAGLRKKIGEAADTIETIRGIGYRFVNE